MERSAKNGFAIHRAALPSTKGSGHLDEDDSGQATIRTIWLDKATPFGFYDVPQHVTAAAHTLQAHSDEILQS